MAVLAYPLEVPSSPARRLAAVGLLLLAPVPATLVALALDPRLLDGVPVWLKPLKFQLATGLHLLSVALCLAALPRALTARRRVRLPLVAMAAASILEVAWITLRGAQGLPSHFAQDGVGALAYDLMGAGAVAIVACTAWLGWLVLRSPPGRLAPALHRAAALGLLLSGGFGLVSGLLIGASGGPQIGAAAGSLPLFGWSTTGGDLRVAHFLGIHALQAVPLAGLVALRLAPGRAGLAVGLAALAWGGLTVAALLQALAGQPFLPL